MDVWQTELFEDILNAGKQPEEALEEMLDWIFADHRHKSLIMAVLWGI